MNCFRRNKDRKQMTLKMLWILRKLTMKLNKHLKQQKLTLRRYRKNKSRKNCFPHQDHLQQIHSIRIQLSRPQAHAAPPHSEGR